MAEVLLNVSRPGSAESPLNCAICLGPLTNKCLTDSCKHEFCFTCLLQWSKVKAECPLCKQRFTTIRHNCKPTGEYDSFVIKPVEEVHLIDDLPGNDYYLLNDQRYAYLPTAPPARAEFHFNFRTTYTVDSNGRPYQFLYGDNLFETRYVPRRRRETSSTNFRRSIYNQNLWAYAPPDLSGRYRDVTPQFYSDNPHARNRLVPWLNRELNALLMDNSQLVMHLVGTILQYLTSHHICSRTFRFLLNEYLTNKTDHFIHEFYNFMRSPYDMIGYDRHVIYTERPHSPTPYIDISDYEDNSSDVVIISGEDNEMNRNTVPEVIDLVDTDSDEPIIVSEEPATSQPRSMSSEDRKPILPLKLRLKHKRQSRERRKRKHRSSTSSSSTTLLCSLSSASVSSTSSSTSSDSSSSSDNLRNCYRRYKHIRKPKAKKLKIRSQLGSSSDTEVHVINDLDSSDSDNVPLSKLKSKKRKSTKKSRPDRKRKTSQHSTTSRHSQNNHNEQKPPLSKQLKQVLKEVVRDLDGPSSSSCSSTTSSSFSTSRSNFYTEQQEAPQDLSQTGQYSRYGSLTPPLNLSLNNRSEPNSINTQLCNVNTTNNLNLKTEIKLSPLYNSSDSSNLDNDCDYKQPKVKSAVWDVRNINKNNVQPVVDNPGPSGSNSTHPKTGRLRNVIIKKEEASNTWYSRPKFNYSDSSEDES